MSHWVLQWGWSVPMAAEAQGCSAATGYKWIRRSQAEGPEGLRDRSSRPHRSPGRLSPVRERAILERRARTLEGPHRIAWALGEAPDGRFVVDDRVHSSCEQAVDTRCHRSSCRYSAANDGFDRSKPYARTVSVARRAHQYYGQ